MKFLGYVSTSILLFIAGFITAHFDLINKVINFVNLMLTKK